MSNLTLLQKQSRQRVSLALLFPLWGVGALQLLIRSVNDFSYSTIPSVSEATLSCTVSFIFALGLLSTGIILTLRVIWSYQSQKIPRLDRFCKGLNSDASNLFDYDNDSDYEHDYDTLPQLHARAMDNLSYTRVWYLSFQNHLLSKSGLETVKLTPLKRWPSILQNEMLEDIVPVWNLPLLLISLAAVPVLALLIAAADVIMRGMTGFAFCSTCLDIDSSIASALTFVVRTFPIPLFLIGCASLMMFVVPPLMRKYLQIRGAQRDAEALRSELLLSSLGHEVSHPMSFSHTHNFAVEPQARQSRYNPSN